MVSPERCHFEEGTCRDSDFARDYCMQPHIVYLAYSSGLKVGITKPENLPTRWIDQGAIRALPIFKVLTRQQSGFIEAAFKNHVSDKTHWQRMLKTIDPLVDLVAARDELMTKARADLEEVIQRFGLNAIQPIVKAEVESLSYPVEQYPSKVSSLNFDKTPKVTGKLQGIKGQYLIFDQGVINLRRFAGYEIDCSLTGTDVETE